MADTLLSTHDITATLKARLPAWRLEGDAIVRTFKTQNWKATMLAAGAIAHLAELAWHHPTLTLNYADVTIALNTHDAGGVTAKDIALAEKIESVIGWQPAPPLEGTPNAEAHRYLVR